ncbi:MULTISPECIES: nucleotidyltransferase family protein [unclassified Thermosipho (in: thermotogales)]|uniref:nucleotidyltransferase family protein n=1 Tax=unclassified Thermosipho (in: thermotogales) TaxID=2676525 RepID=UPI000985BAAC|nr:nucleotidyltransferase family protein [Thermosipho sp. 1223]MBT1247334.1 DNA polymerase [Thermosipho sp. 1244]OOC46935.1 DNA polymerase [Thermosipho sp. 1223]
MNRQEILEELKKHKKALENFGVKKIGIFGSYARNEATKKSDVDIIIEFEEGKATFDNVAGVVDFLEELLEAPVDLLTPAGIESIRIKKVRETIKKEIVYA